MLDSILSGVDARTGRALGSFFEQLARILISNATIAEEAEAANSRRRGRAAATRNSADAIAEMLAAGATFEQALALVSARLGIDADRLRAHYKAASRRGACRRQLERDVRIMRLAGQGMTPRAIGAQVGLSADRVERIIKKMIAAGRDLESLGQRFRHLRSNHPAAANSDDQAPALPSAARSA